MAARSVAVIRCISVVLPVSAVSYLICLGFWARLRAAATHTLKPTFGAPFCVPRVLDSPIGMGAFWAPRCRRLR